MRLTQMIEALLFASDAPLAASDFCRLDERFDEDTVTAVIDELRAAYDRDERSFQVYELAGGFQLLTRPEYALVLERFDTVPRPTKLSMPALEVLAIVAYRQPIGRIEMDEIRGVQSSAVLRTLQERELIEPVGRSEGLGRPLLYGTTRKFLEHFGFQSLEDLPRPSELPVVLQSDSLAASNGAAPAGETVPATAATTTPAPTVEPAPQSSESAAEASEPEDAAPEQLEAGAEEAEPEAVQPEGVEAEAEGAEPAEAGVDALQIRGRRTLTPPAFTTAPAEEAAPASPMPATGPAEETAAAPSGTRAAKIAPPATAAPAEAETPADEPEAHASRSALPAASNAPPSPSSETDAAALRTDGGDGAQDG